MNTWSDRKKTFRLLNRVRFQHPDMPIFADVSIVRSSKRFAKKSSSVMDGGANHFKPMGTNVPIPTYTIQESGVFNNIETYEIELEIDNSKVGNGTMYNTPEKIMDVLRNCIRIVLCGIQQCFYPISFTERDTVLNSYMKTIRGDKDYEYKKINMNDKRTLFSNFVFIGPGSITLQREHILPKKEGSQYGNVLEHYTITDKADGERKLLFIHEDGRIYLIDNNLWQSKYMPGWNADLTTECVEIINTSPICDEWINEPVMIIQRDTFANFFHDSEDFFDVFLGMAILDWSKKDTQFFLTDLYPRGPFWDLWSKVFTSNNKDRKTMTSWDLKLKYGNSIVDKNDILDQISKKKRQINDL
jgi:hypothetical protein